MKRKNLPMEVWRDAEKKSENGGVERRRCREKTHQ